MIKWRIYRNENCSWFDDKQFVIEIHYNDSPIVSYLAAGGPKSPVFDEWTIRRSEIKENISILMDVIHHQNALKIITSFGELAIKELLGI